MASIEKARQLYEAGQYLEAMEMCTALMENGDSPKELWLISAKCLMVNIPSTENDEISKKTTEETVDSLIRAINATNSIEEAFEVWMDFKSAFSLWEKKMVINMLKVVEANPTTENLEKYNKFFMPIFQKNMEITLPAKNKSIMPQLAAANGMELKDAVAKYENGKEFDNRCDDAVRDELEFETAQRIFEKAKDTFERNRVTTLERAKEVQPVVGTSIIVATFVYNAKNNIKRTGIPNDVKFARLQAYTQWQRLLLEGCFEISGTKKPMYTPNDNSDVETIKMIYNEMQRLNPSFVAPPLPVPHRPQQQKSGGCYVATAVYGSYDCPQVWTLRRYRDDVLAESWYGRAFIRTYYAISPTLVKWFGHTQWFKNMWKGKLDRMVKKLQDNGTESTPYEDKNW